MAARDLLDSKVTVAVIAALLAGGSVTVGDCAIEWHFGGKTPAHRGILQPGGAVGFTATTDEDDLAPADVALSPAALAELGAIRARDPESVDEQLAEWQLRWRD